ncbi:hypothetical protein [Neobacillus mesonae]|uniref:Uncharacterized protein n=1 Tax=Neobacillus mesonae TaxID=1193713 RepID=A0A3T0HV48_9BACI|nr:hypothetical protein [Neobacillus mesonae]AZU61020.1 hypothetical protein CHR53_07010 [Neobacillus mesonae]
MGEIVWQLPVNQNRGFEKEVHHKAKYHAFKNSISLCRKYGQDTDYFETGIDELELMLNKDLACKKCLKELQA